MRLLADENFPGALVRWLRELRHDVVWALTDYPRYPDVQILEIAESEGRILLTLDRDFVQLTRQRRKPIFAGGVVVLKSYRARIDTIAPLVAAFLTAEHQWTGRVHVISAEGIEPAF